VPPWKAVKKAFRVPCLASLAVLEFALTAIIVPTYAERADKIAPIENVSAVKNPNVKPMSSAKIMPKMRPLKIVYSNRLRRIS